MKELAGEYGYEVREDWPGIYGVRGDIFGVQVVETKKLREGDGGIWLREIREGLKGEELREILERGRGTEGPVRAYLHVLLQANTGGFEEMVKMGDAVTIEDVLKKYGFTARWEAKAREEGREEGWERGREEGWERGWGQAVKRLRKHGMDPAAIAEALELEPAAVSKYLDLSPP
jgi:hypothetical protein